MFKVALVVPFIRKENEKVSYMEYLGFASIAAYLRKYKIEVEIIDAYLQNLNIDSVCEKLINGNFNLIGFTLMSSEFFQNTEIILSNIIEKIDRRCKVIVGGYYATFNSRKILEEQHDIDVVIIGEGEKTILDLINSIVENKGFKDVLGIQYREDNNIIKNKPRTIMTSQELTQLPMMARDTAEIVSNQKGRLQMLSSRGCYGNCDFCGVNKYTSRLKGEKWRYREAEDVVNEMELLVNTYNIKEIIFLDEEFVGVGEVGKNRARKIAQQILDRNLKINFLIYSKSNNVDFETFEILKRAGLKTVFLGLEFGVQRILDFYNKGITINDNINAIKILKQLSIALKPGYIMFEPSMNLQELKDNMIFYYKYIGFRPNNLINKLGLYKETPAYNKIKKITYVGDKEFLHPDFGDCVEYKFADEKVECVYDLLTTSFARVENFNNRRSRMFETASSQQEAILIQKKFEEELFKSVVYMIEQFQAIERFDKKVVGKICDEFNDMLDYINNQI